MALEILPLALGYIREADKTGGAGSDIDSREAVIGMAGPQMTTSLATAQAAAVLRVEDYDRAKRFYQDTLGLKVVDSAGPTREGRVFAGKDTVFSIYERPGIKPPTNTALAFVTDDFDGTMRDLRARGIVFQEYDMPDMGLVTTNGVASFDHSKAAWFADSEGNLIVLSTSL